MTWFIGRNTTSGDRVEVESDGASVSLTFGSPGNHSTIHLGAEDIADVVRVLILTYLKVFKKRSLN